MMAKNIRETINTGRAKLFLYRIVLKKLSVKERLTKVKKILLNIKVVIVTDRIFEGWFSSIKE